MIKLKKKKKKDFSVISRSPFYFDYEEKKKTKNESVDYHRIPRKLGCNKKKYRVVKCDGNS